MKVLQSYYLEILKHAAAVGAGLAAGGLGVYSVYTAAKTGVIKAGMGMMMAKANNSGAKADDLDLTITEDNDDSND